MTFEVESKEYFLCKNFVITFAVLSTEYCIYLYNDQFLA